MPLLLQAEIHDGRPLVVAVGVIALGSRSALGSSFRSARRAASLAALRSTRPIARNMAAMHTWFGRCECKPGEDSFYNEANGWWANDESIQIPGEYSSWGSFIQLHDASLKVQVEMCKDLSEKASNEDEKKVAMIWNARMSKFKEWDAGKGDYAPILGELAELSALPLDSADAWSAALGKHFAKCIKSGISIPLSFDKGPNLSDSEHVVLDLSPSSGSLPSRDYYTEANFSEQRAQFKEHLTKVAALVGLETDFAERVMRFETKLAQISMKPDQSRQYDQYFTVTTLDGFLSGANEMKALADKLENYGANTVEAGDPDAAVLKETGYRLDAQQMPAVEAFVRLLYSELGLEACLKKNYKEQYTDQKGEGATLPASPETAELRMIVFDGDFFRRVFPLILSVHNARDLVAYMKYNVIKWGGGYCTKALDEEIFDFHSRKLGGQKEQKSPEKRTVGIVNSWAGELLGKVYVDRFFSLDDKVKLQSMIGEVLDVMRRSLKTNDWLTAPTKDKALAKLAKFTTKIGFPDKWKDHARLSFEAGDDILALRRKVAAFELQSEFYEKVNTPKDKTKWEMHPHQVNAYFHPLNNEIVFPAAILQPPFYHKQLHEVQFCLELDSGPQHLDAVNFGAIGAVIAHEITHGYDDQGRKFDDCGNIADWWQEADAELFKAKTQKMKAQAEQYVYIDTESGAEHKMNGDLTMGENLADLGGMSLAVQALEERIKEGAVDADTAKLFYQLFFRSWANVWKSKNTNADTVKKLSTDPHAPPPFRCNLVKNVDLYYTAFDVEEGSANYLPKEQRVQMW